MNGKFTIVHNKTSYMKGLKIPKG